MQKVVIITGPTAVGKTKCSLAIAKHFNTELINGDAYQVYQKMNIGTAKPSLEELSLIKHHLIDFIAPDETFSVADYQKKVRQILDEFKNKAMIPIIVGGSGLYLESVICDYTFSGNKRDDSFEQQYSEYDNQSLYSLLQKNNPNLAVNIHPNNRKRVLRALELTNSNNTKGINKKTMLYDALVIFLNDDRERLYTRINNRVDKMVEQGLIEEVKSLYPDKLSLTAKAAIGYKELFSYFDGEITLDEAIAKIKQVSRNYAKRQLTWFRNKEYVKIVDIDDSNFENTIEKVQTLINDFLYKQIN